MTALMLTPTAISTAPATDETPEQHLHHLVSHLAHLLPAQGPITVFIHHNTLHAFEDLPFDEAVQRGGSMFGCEPYMSEAQYRACLERGRIRHADLPEIVRHDLGVRADDVLMGLSTRLAVRLAMLEHPLRDGSAEELQWFMAETDALKQVRPEMPAALRARLIAESKHWTLRDLRGQQRPALLADLLTPRRLASMESWGDQDWEGFALTSLWRICCAGVAMVPAEEPRGPTWPRHRDALLKTTGTDTDLLVHEMLIRFTAAFVDQGFSHWMLPHREDGFYRSFLALFGQPGTLVPHWARTLPKELRRLFHDNITASACLHESLALLGVPRDEWEGYLSSALLALRGWAGMVHQLEERGDRVREAVPEGCLLDFVAVRLLLDRVAIQSLTKTPNLHELRAECASRFPADRPRTTEERAFLIFQLAQLLGWTPSQLFRLRATDWQALTAELEAFHSIERRRLFHLAFERKFYTQTLDALALHTGQPQPTPARPRLQAIFCIDDREESFRRHLEEVAPDTVTYSMAGFFAVPMYYRGLADAHFAALCPVVLRPQHWVIEQVDETQANKHQRWARTRRVLGLASHRVTSGSRAFALGALLTAVVGLLAGFPLLMRIWFPRLTALLRQGAGGLLRRPRQTRLVLERQELTCAPAPKRYGFTLDEMANMSERVLRDTGLTTHYARLILIFGHGSSSVNNPHESAYDCGACGGARGGPNGRAIAQMLNHPEVRERLAQRGLRIPPDTHFVGVLHNTCNDALTYFDLDALPEGLRGSLATVRRELDEVCARNAHERSRRLMSAPLSLSTRGAKLHVEGRAEDLAQVRPELGHATNAICIVGRRARTRGLFLDRRAFLNSYDPTQDDADGTILAGILRAAVPVCGGINLEYYFSFVDRTGYGAGSKLPHNVTSLLGVMDGAGSDLRTGLPWQMVEIHEPVRLLFVIETTPAVILGIMERLPLVATYIRHGWVQLALLAPDAPTLQVYRDGAFHPYEPTTTDLAKAATSQDWYRGWRDHLEFAAIG